MMWLAAMKPLKVTPTHERRKSNTSWVNTRIFMFISLAMIPLNEISCMHKCCWRGGGCGDNTKATASFRRRNFSSPFTSESIGVKRFVCEATELSIIDRYTV